MSDPRGVITKDECVVLLSRRIQRATLLDHQAANRVAEFLLTSNMVTVYTMFYAPDDAAAQHRKDKK